MCRHLVAETAWHAAICRHMAFCGVGQVVGGGSDQRRDASVRWEATAR